MDTGSIPIELTALQAVQEFMKYEGFDPNVIMRRMLIAYKEYEVSVAADPGQLSPLAV